MRESIWSRGGGGGGGGGREGEGSSAGAHFAGHGSLRPSVRRSVRAPAIATWTNRCPARSQKGVASLSLTVLSVDLKIVANASRPRGRFGLSLDLKIGSADRAGRRCPLTCDAKPNNREWRHGARTDDGERAQARARRVSVAGAARDERRVDREVRRGASRDSRVNASRGGARHRHRPRRQHQPAMLIVAFQGIL